MFSSIHCQLLRGSREAYNTGDFEKDDYVYSGQSIPEIDS